MSDDEDPKCGACKLCIDVPGSIKMCETKFQSLGGGETVLCEGKECKADGQMDREAEAYCVSHDMAICAICMEKLHPDDEVALCLGPDDIKGLYMISHAADGDGDEDPLQEEAQEEAGMSAADQLAVATQEASSPTSTHATLEFEANKAARLEEERKKTEGELNDKIAAAESAYAEKSKLAKTVEEKRANEVEREKAIEEARVAAFEKAKFGQSGVDQLEAKKKANAEAEQRAKEEGIKNREKSLMRKGAKLTEFERKKEEAYEREEAIKEAALLEKEAALYGSSADGIAQFEAAKAKRAEEAKRKRSLLVKVAEKEKFSTQKNAVSDFEGKKQQEKEEAEAARQAEEEQKQQTLQRRQTAAASKRAEEKAERDRLEREKAEEEDRKRKAEVRKKARAVEMFEYGQKWRKFDDETKDSEIATRFEKFMHLREGGITLATIQAHLEAKKFRSGDDAKAIFDLEDVLTEEEKERLRLEEEERLRKEAEEAARIKREEEEAAAKKAAEEVAAKEAAEAAEKEAEALRAASSGKKGKKGAKGKAKGKAAAKGDGGAEEEEAAEAKGCCVIA